MENLQFIDMFPPLCNRIRVELRDSDTMSDDVIATHFIELSQIMDPGGDAEGRINIFYIYFVYLLMICLHSRFACNLTK